MNFKYGSVGSESTMGSIQTDGIDLKINATSDLLLLPGSNVGIGTTTPNYLLDVEKSGANVRIYDTTGNTTLNLSSSNTANNNIEFGDTDDANVGRIIYRHASDSMSFTTNASEAMRIDSDGDVGIGKTSPGFKLDVEGSQGNVARFTSTSTTGGFILANSGTTDTVAIQSQNDNLQFRVDNGYIDLKTNTGATATSRMRILSNGNVGIGTTSPAYPLDVTGNVRFTGDLIVQGGQIDTANVQARVKYSVWSGTTYGIGMQNNYNYGHLNNDYAMTFQMNSDNDRGFWWGDNSHTNSQGAMSLSTNGKATIATSLSVGEGESITSPSDKTLHVNGETETTNLSYPEPGALDSSAYNGEIVYFGTQISMTEGKLMVLSTSAGGLTWYLAKDSTTSLATGMLGIALGTAASDGVLVRGIAKNSAWSSFSEGEKLYLSPTGGSISNSITSDTNDFVRIVGYALGGSKIYFCPDNTYVQNS